VAFCFLNFFKENLPENPTSSKSIFGVDRLIDYFWKNAVRFLGQPFEK